LFTRHCIHLDLHSFPTRRSSDLASDNPVAISFGERLRQFFQNEEYARLVNRTPEQVRLVLAEHAQILESILLGNLDRLRSVLVRSEEHTSELQSRENLVCRLMLE